MNSRRLLSALLLLGLPAAVRAQCISSTSYPGRAAAAGETSSISVNTLTPPCNWSVSSNDSWITFVGPTSGTATAPFTISYVAAGNSSQSPRTGQIRLSSGGPAQTINVTQNTVLCTFSITPIAANFSSAGGNGSYTLASSPAGCFVYGGVSGPTWVSFGGSSSPTAPSTMTDTVSPNTGDPRTAPISPAVDPPASITQTVKQSSQVAITSSTLPNGVLGVAFEIFPHPAALLATGGTPPYHWSATGLPPGLGLGSDGIFAGTPTSTGTFTTTVTVTDSFAPPQSAARVYPFVIAAPLTFTPSFLPNGVVNVTYPTTTLQGQGGIPPYSFQTTGDLPPGLRLSSTGVFSGTPALAGTFNFGVRILDSANPQQPAVRGYAVTISPELLITTTALPGGVVRRPYSGATLRAEGGTAPYRWSAAGLPAGLNLSADGTFGGTPADSGTFSVTFTATDNSAPPQVASRTLSLAIASELILVTTALPGGLVTRPYANTTLQAQGGTAPYTWSATGLPPGLSVNPAGAVAGTPTTAGTFQVTISATDNSTPPQTASRTLPLTIVSGLAIITTALPNGVVHQPYSGAALQAQGGTAPYIWSATGLPPGLSVTPAGAVAGTPAAAGTFQVTISATDNSTPPQTASRTLPLTIVSGLAITTTALPNGVVHQPYSGAALQAQGGTAPYTWSATGLPPGLSVTPAGAVAGTPTTAGTFQVTISATDNSTPPQTASRTLSLTIVSGLGIITTALPIGVAQQPYSGAALQAQGGTAPYTWSASGLPPGLALSPVGTLSGTPTTTGSFNVSILTTDSSSPPQTTTRIFSLTILAALSITTSSLPNGVVNQPYLGATLQAQGGTPPYGWSAASLPSGLSLSAEGTLTGTPNVAGTFNLTVTATDSSSPPRSASSYLSLTVATGLTIITAALPGGVVSQGYAATNLRAQGGTAPYTWSAANLPPGFLLSTAGALTGSPIAAGLFAVTVTVTDRSVPPQTSTKVLSLLLVERLAIATATLPNGVVDQVYTSHTLQAQGGTAPYSWAAEGLPPGLFLSPTGMLTGTPGAAGAFAITVSVNDSASPPRTAATVLSLTIALRLVISSSSLPSGVVQQPYLVTLEARGGTAPYSWAATGLPAGLSLSPAGSLIGSPGAAGAFPVTVAATDSSTPPQIATTSLSLAIASLLTVTTATLPGGAINQAYAGAVLQAQGGTPPYNWSAANLPPALSLNTAGSLTGTPGVAGDFPVIFTVKDSAAPPQTASKSLSVTIKTGTPPPPLFNISVSTRPASLTDQPQLTLRLNEPYPLRLEARFAISFTPDAAGVPAANYSSPALQFATGGKLTTITIQPNTTNLPIAGIQLGDVAGTITVTLMEVREGGSGQLLELVGTPPSATIAVPRLAPIVTLGSVRFVDVTTSGFAVELTAASTPRDLTSATVNFTATIGTQLTGSSHTIALSALATEWFASASGQKAGGSFTLKLPFSYTGDPNAIASATVTLVNSTGASAPVSGNK